MKALPKRKGNPYPASAGSLTFDDRLNESPSQKEGKFSDITFTAANKNLKPQ